MSELRKVRLRLGIGNDKDFIGGKEGVFYFHCIHNGYAIIENPFAERVRFFSENRYRMEDWEIPAKGLAHVPLWHIFFINGNEQQTNKS